jgi:hypothetical protein
MLIASITIVLSDVIVAEKSIALVALGANGLVANGGPVSAVNVVRNRRITGVMFGVHTDIPQPRMSEKHTAFSRISG